MRRFHLHGKGMARPHLKTYLWNFDNYKWPSTASVPSSTHSPLFFYMLLCTKIEELTLDRSRTIRCVFVCEKSPKEEFIAICWDSISLWTYHTCLNNIASGQKKGEGVSVFLSNCRKFIFHFQLFQKPFSDLNGTIRVVRASQIWMDFGSLRPNLGRGQKSPLRVNQRVPLNIVTTEVRSKRSKICVISHTIALP